MVVLIVPASQRDLLRFRTLRRHRAIRVASGTAYRFDFVFEFLYSASMSDRKLKAGCWRRASGVAGKATECLHFIRPENLRLTTRGKPRCLASA